MARPRICWLMLAACLLVSPYRSPAASSIIVSGADTTFALAELASGAGSDFPQTIHSNSSFTVSVTSSGPCEVYVQMVSSVGWLTDGRLVVQIETAGVYGNEIVIDQSSRLLLSSGGPLANQAYTLRYSLKSVTTRNPPGSYSGSITFTVNDI